jgi:hypothetical protein
MSLFVVAKLGYQVWGYWIIDYAHLYLGLISLARVHEVVLCLLVSKPGPRKER